MRTTTCSALALSIALLATAPVPILAATPEHTLTEARTIGRAQLPTTVVGAIFHAAEHAARHTGQIVTTAKLVR